MSASAPHALDVLGEGVATAPDLSDARTPRRTSVYADPVSWLVLEAVERAVEAYGGDLRAARDGVGHIVVSDHCTAHTMRELAATIPAGRISPLRFSGANPGSVCGLSAQLLGFGGPSLTLSMPPEKGLPPAMAVARVWLAQGTATHVLVTTHRADASGHRVTSTILRETQREG
ncbi:coronafacic acid synthetase [Streptomyces sp. YKOK-I1]